VSLDSSNPTNSITNQSSLPQSQIGANAAAAGD
jgi:hypothetical protein